MLVCCVPGSSEIRNNCPAPMNAVPSKKSLDLRGVLAENFSRLDAQIGRIADLRLIDVAERAVRAHQLAHIVLQGVVIVIGVLQKPQVAAELRFREAGVAAKANAVDGVAWPL